ncbi:MAG: hypothetical protein AB7O04_06045 [Hyphomonadaceae bacterium]
MRIAVFSCALVLAAVWPLAAKTQDWRSEIEVSTPVGGFSVRPDEPGFADLRAAPFFFRPGFLYEYQDRCRRGRCLVDVIRLSDGRWVAEISAPRAPRWLIETEATEAPDSEIEETPLPDPAELWGLPEPYRR